MHTRDSCPRLVPHAPYRTNVYADLFEDDMDQVADRLDGGNSAGSASPRPTHSMPPRISPC